MAGMGLAGLCQKDWTFLYLPPILFVLDLACDGLVARAAWSRKRTSNLSQLLPGAVFLS